MNDTQRAKEFMVKEVGEWFTPEELKQGLGLKISTQTLGRKLRGFVDNSSIFSRYRDGKNYKEFAFAPGYVDNIEKTYFFTLTKTAVPSPYYSNLQAVMIAAKMVSDTFRIWSGDYKSPILEEVK